MKAKTLPLAQIRAKSNVLVVKAILNIAIIDLITFFNIGKQMDENQIISTIDLLIEEFYYLRPEDFKYCFNLAKKGHFGKVYDRIDGQVIFEWVNQYCIDRASYFETNGLNEKKEIEKNPINYHAVQKFHELYGKDMKDREKQKSEEYSRFKAQYELSKLKQNAENNNGKD